MVKFAGVCSGINLALCVGFGFGVVGGVAVVVVVWQGWRVRFPAREVGFYLVLFSFLFFS
jgi:hypothetical protein